METQANKSIGAFICEQRKAKGLTQKELAEKLNITDKAVSKWERDICYPDISLIIPLAEILEISTSELLNGGINISNDTQTTETLINKAIKFSSKSSVQKAEKIKQNILYGLSASFLIAIIVCLICDYFLTGNLSWSLIVIVSLVFSMLILFTLLTAKEKLIKKTLITLSVFIIPYLALLSFILKQPLVFYLGSCISVITATALWLSYIAFVKLPRRKYLAIGISFLMIIPLNLLINNLTQYFINDASFNQSDNILNSSITLSLAIFCFCIDYIKNRLDNK